MTVGDVLLTLRAAHPTRRAPHQGDRGRGGGRGYSMKKRSHGVILLRRDFYLRMEVV